MIWQDYPELLRLAADMIEPVVNASLAARERYPLEYAGEWRANFCGANRYDGASSGCSRIYSSVNGARLA
jgi:hypothetical protein